jgi:hypothetical protein
MESIPGEEKTLTKSQKRTQKKKKRRDEERKRSQAPVTCAKGHNFGPMGLGVIQYRYGIKATPGESVVLQTCSVCEKERNRLGMVVLFFRGRGKIDKDFQSKMSVIPKSSVRKVWKEIYSLRHFKELSIDIGEWETK